MTRVALFDMDKTLVRENTAKLFTRYLRDQGEATFGDSLQVSWWLLKYSLGLLNAPEVAKKALATYRGTRESEMARKCEHWFPNYVLPFVSPEARRAVEKHRGQNDHLVIATSATVYGAEPLRKELRMDAIVCSEMEVVDGCFTGQVVDPLCYAEGKKRRTSAWLEARGFSLRDATFYSDSITDLPLLEAVGTPVAVNPDIWLTRKARKRGWRIEQW